MTLLIVDGAVAWLHAVVVDEMCCIAVMWHDVVVVMYGYIYVPVCLHNFFF